ncbi:MAG: hypothetical protein WD960_05940 [Gemmatimonadota bacterium]
MIWIALIVLALLLPEILSTVLDSRVGRAIALRLESGAGNIPDDLTGERLRHLEEEVDRLGRQLQQLDERAEFLQELLADRPSRDQSQLPPGDGSS